MLRFLFQVPKALKNNNKTKKIIYKRIFTYEWYVEYLYDPTAVDHVDAVFAMFVLSDPKTKKQRESAWYVPNYLTPEWSNDTRTAPSLYR